MKNFPLLSVLITVFIVGCKTTADIEREQLVDSMSVQVVEQQKLLSENNLKIQEIDERMNQIYGQLEETRYEDKQKILEKENERVKTLSELSERLNVLETRITNLENRFDTQEQFIKKTTSTLKKISSSPKQKSISSSTDALYVRAMANFDKKYYKTAIPLLEDLIDNKKLTAAKRVRARHALGIIHYNQKKYDDALVLFSKIFTSYPKSSKAPSSLFYIAQSFLKKSQKNDAKNTLNQLIKQYPRSKEAKQAKVIVKDL